MTTLGIFAGRGDVILFMLMSGILGFYLGWQANKLKGWIKSKLGK